jgi:hypothetical protein
VKTKRTAARRPAAGARRGAPRFREDLLEALSNADGVSGGEEVVRALVADAVRDRVDSMEVDAL